MNETTEPTAALSVQFSSWMQNSQNSADSNDDSPKKFRLWSQSASRSTSFALHQTFAVSLNWRLVTLWYSRQICFQSHLAALPLVGNVGSEFHVAHHLPHVLDGGIRRHEVVIRQLEIFMKSWHETTREILFIPSAATRMITSSLTKDPTSP